MTERAFASLWGLSYEEIDFLSRFGVRLRLMIACQLLFFRCHGRFPDDKGELDPDVIAYVADQTDAPDDASYAFFSDTARRHRGLILDFLGIRRATSQDREKLWVWMIEHLGGRSLSLSDWVERGYGKARDMGLFVPSAKIMECLARGAHVMISAMAFWRVPVRS